MPEQGAGTIISLGLGRGLQRSGAWIGLSGMCKKLLGGQGDIPRSQARGTAFIEAVLRKVESLGTQGLSLRVGQQKHGETRALSFLNAPLPDLSTPPLALPRGISGSFLHPDCLQPQLPLSCQCQNYSFSDHVPLAQLPPGCIPTTAKEKSSPSPSVASFHPMRAKAGPVPPF